jgi:hypothetical protein
MKVSSFTVYVGMGFIFTHTVLLMAITYSPRETREGWPLLNIETEVNGDSKGTTESGPFLVVSLVGLVVPLQEIFVPPWLL